MNFPYKPYATKRYRKNCIVDLVGALQEVFSERGLLSSQLLAWFDTTMLITKIARKLGMARFPAIAIEKKSKFVILFVCLFVCWFFFFAVLRAIFFSKFGKWRERESQEIKQLSSCP